MPAERMLLVGSLLVAVAITAAGCGSKNSATAARAGSAARTGTLDVGQQQLHDVTVMSAGSLPSGLADPALARLADGRLVLLGGLDEAGASTASITVLAGSRVSAHGELPAPQHDSQATAFGHDVYVFGGGDVSSYSHILRYDPATGKVTQVGTLPSAASDVAVASIGNTGYVVGGYDGSRWLDTILAWRPGSSARVVAHLPVGLRYAAVAAVGGRLMIAGGTTPSGVSDAIFTFDPVTARLVRLGRLPVGLAHASAAVLGDRVLIIGGRRQASGDRTASVLAIDPGSGAVRDVGKLPQRLSDAAAATGGNRVLVIGGDSTAGPQRSILALTPHFAPAVTSSP